MRPNPVCWFEIYVQDMARAKAFYEGVFDTRLTRLEAPGIEMWTFGEEPDKPGCTGALVHLEGVPCGGSGTLVYFSCADCAVEESRVVAQGGTIHRAKMSIGPHGFISLVVDTEGNLIGLHSLA
jgi:hypothetical protein